MKESAMTDRYMCRGVGGEEICTPPFVPPELSTTLKTCWVNISIGCRAHSWVIISAVSAAVAVDACTPQKVCSCGPRKVTVPDLDPLPRSLPHRLTTHRRLAYIPSTWKTFTCYCVTLNLHVMTDLPPPFHHEHKRFRYIELYYRHLL